MAFTMKQGDTRPIYIAQLKENFGTPDEAAIDLSASGTTVQFLMRSAAGNKPLKVEAEAQITNAAQGIVAYTWDGLAGDTDEAGDFEVEFEITWPDGGVETVPNIGYLEVKIVDDVN